MHGRLIKENNKRKTHNYGSMQKRVVSLNEGVKDGFMGEAALRALDAYLSLNSGNITTLCCFFFT